MPLHAHPQRIQAAVAVIERRGCVLICRRRAGDRFGGYWEFPGGKRESGESWQACLRRELCEELGVSIRAVRPYGSMRHEERRVTIVLRVFRCAIARGVPHPLDAQTLRWVPVRHLTRYRFPPANTRLLQRLAAG